ncbi:MAG: Gfo/Idh/MocA family oxidoreductase [Phycisphaerales bacterium]|nr:Gfo/Idh/MocA family oxidoreductase [Phycisphaerales bacterium]
MAEVIRVGIAGAGWPGLAQGRAIAGTRGMKVVAVADLIPARRRTMMDELKITQQYADASELVRDKNLDAICVCLPNDLHAATVSAALRAGKHVLCETPPAVSLKETRAMKRTADNSGKVLMYALQRRFGSHELAAQQAIDKGYIGQGYHVRAVWTRTRGIPVGTGWYTQQARSGGGAMIDIGLPMLDLAWSLLGQPKPVSVYAVNHSRFTASSGDKSSDVEDAAFVLVKFENDKSLELASSWAINQPPTQNGTVCRVYGTEGAIEVYTRQGPMIYRKFDEAGNSKSQPLTGPKISGHDALLRAFRKSITERQVIAPGPDEGIVLMELIEAIYRSAQSGKSVNL